MFLGYNTNGFAHHRLDDAIAIVASLGYRGLALTLDVHHLDPRAPQLPKRLAALRQQLEQHQLRCVIETGARFLLDPWRKHQPTLLSPSPAERDIRFRFLTQSIDIAAELRADAVSFWSGTPTDEAPTAELMNRLVASCCRLADYAATRNVRLAFEPEPGMFIDTMDRFAALFARVNHPYFGLTLDIGHLVCHGEVPVSRIVTQWQTVLWNLHIEDMIRGVHDHRMFGEGEVDFTDVFAGLQAAGYSSGVYVELSRHSHDAVATARRSLEFLQRYLVPT